LGDFYTDSLHSHDGLLTDGVLELKGNFSQLRSTGNGSHAHNFLSKGSLRIEISGSKPQIISFANPGASLFNEVIYRNPTAGNIRWTSAVAVSKPIQVLVKVAKPSEMTSVIRDNSGQIQCGEYCETLITLGTELRLEIEFHNKEILTGWTGACAGSKQTCQITVNDVVVTEALLAQGSTSAGKRRKFPLWVIMAAQEK